MKADDKFFSTFVKERVKTKGYILVHLAILTSPRYNNSCGYPPDNLINL